MGLREASRAARKVKRGRIVTAKQWDKASTEKRSEILHKHRKPNSGLIKKLRRRSK